MTRMGQFYFAEDAPAVHIWTGDESIPIFAPALLPELAMAGSRPMPPAVVRQRSKGMKTAPLEAPGWKITMNDTAVVRGDIPADGLKAAAVYAEELFVMNQSYLGSAVEDFSGIFPIRIFDNCLDFRKHAARLGASNAESLYDPISTEIAHCFRTHLTPQLFQRAFAHEFNHAYVHRLFKRKEPIWFMEGVAEWFSNLDWRAGIFIPGQVNERAVLLCRLEPRDLRKLMNLAREDMYGPSFAVYYAQAWSFVDFIMTQTPPSTLHDILVDYDPDALLDYEEGWKAHVARM